MTAIKFCGFNNYDLKQAGDEGVSEFREIALKENSKDFLITSAAFYEVQVFNDLMKFSIISSLKEDVQTTVSCTKKIINIQISDVVCYFFHENGDVSEYNVLTRELKQLNLQFSNKNEHLKCISATFKELYGVTTSNSLYQLVPVYKHIHDFPSHQKIKKMASGLEHTVILTANGDVFSFGCGLRGQLGHGDVRTYDSPKLIEAISGIKIISIDCGAFHSVCASSFGDLYTFGWNTNGQLGTSKSEYQVSTLPLVVDLEDETDAVKEVYCGHKHTLIRTERNRLFSAGLNSFGQLGVGDFKDHDKFIEIPLKELNNDKFVIKCGYWSTFMSNG